MIAARSYKTAGILFLLLCALAGWSQTDSPRSTPAEYRAELERLRTATGQLDSSSDAVPESLKDLPDNWRVSTEQGDFDVPTEGLKRDVRRYESHHDAEHATAVRSRVESLVRQIDGFERRPDDVTSKRSELDKILSRAEFGNVSGPTWFDRLKERFFEFLIDVLRRVFGSAAIPTISKYFVYGLIAAAVVLLAYVVFRNIQQGRRFDSVIPQDLPVSAKEWTIWLAEARAAAARSEWRDAIHLAYWAGISFLEREGTWKPDRARTPREYLRLLSSASEHRETLQALTRIFELAWYAKRDASEASFSLTLEQLEKLGCR